MTTVSTRSRATLNGRRPAMTLIEIMSSILVLSVGLVGVLAAIPFGGFRLAQMSEADNSSSVGRDAVRLIKSNGWADPNNWYLINKSNGSAYSSSILSILTDASSNELIGLNLTYPFLIDPLANLAYTPVFYPQNPSNAPAYFYTSVAPVIGTGNLLNDFQDGLPERFERAFYLPDDVASGYDSYEDETAYRPQLEMEDDMVLGNGVIPAFTGRYSWMATVYPQPSTEPFYNCPLSNIKASDYDVVVFRDRIMNDEKGVEVVVDGSGYMGGTITIDLSSMLDNQGQNAHDAIDRERFLEQLETTRYIMLMGNDDYPLDSRFRKFARWYKIANYSVINEDVDGAPLQIRASLIGPDMPKNWSEAQPTIAGLFFPGVVGVYSGSATF